MTEAPKTALFIPAYEAEATLAGVLRRIPESFWDHILRVFIVDDGSRDATFAVAQRLSRHYPRVEVHRFEKNRGYGPAVKKGLELARESGCDYAVCLHADGQYPPEEIPAFTAFMARQGIDLLQGSRHRDGTALLGGMPLYKYIAGKALTFLENRAFGLALTDYHSGFLCYSRRALESLPFAALSPYFEFDLEVIASARARGLRIAELGIPTRYGREKSHLQPLKYGFRVLGVLRRYRNGFYHALGERSSYG